MADDDLFGFFSELKEVKPTDEEAACATELSTAAGTGKGTQQGPASPPGGSGGKRPRDDDDDDAAPAIGPAGPPPGTVLGSSAGPDGSPQPVLKKAKVVVAKAKPQLHSAEEEEPPQPKHYTPAPSVSAGPTRAPEPEPVEPPPPSAGTYHPYNAAYQHPNGGSFYPPLPPGPPPGQSQQPMAYGAAIQAAQAAKPKKFIRVGAGQTFSDPTLNEWPDNDFRLFVGDLGPEVNDDMLGNAFKTKYTSFAKAKVLREKQTGKSRGYGFVSFLDPFEGLKAMREMNGKYIGSRPCKLKKSDWKDRDLKTVQKKEKAKKKFLGKLGLS